MGCAWATLVVNYTMLALAVWLLRTQSIYPCSSGARWSGPMPTLSGFFSWACLQGWHHGGSSLPSR